MYLFIRSSAWGSFPIIACQRHFYVVNLIWELQHAVIKSGLPYNCYKQFSEKKSFWLVEIQLNSSE